MQMFKTDYGNYLKHQNKPNYLFFDRSFLDSAALLAQIAAGKMEHVNDIINRYRYYNKVFIAPPWKEIYKNDAERDQLFEEAVQTYQMLTDWYLSKQYQLIILPLDDVDTRVKFILNELGIRHAGN
jgi:predicted ATPase